MSLSAQSTQFYSLLFYCIVSVWINKIFIHSFIELHYNGFILTLSMTKRVIDNEADGRNEAEKVKVAHTRLPSVGFRR